MAKIIKKGRYGTLRECEESDPIYSEGWTIGAVIRPRQAEEEKKPKKSEEPPAYKEFGRNDAFAVPSTGADFHQLWV